MRSLLQDLKLAYRHLATKPGTALVIVLSLGLALAGNAVLFSVIEALLLRPFPYPEPDRVALVWASDRNLPGWQGLRPLSASAFLELEQRAQTFGSLAAIRGRSLQMGGDGGPDEVSGLAVSPAFFEVLGVPPAQGRAFLAADGVPGAANVAILTDELWQSRFAGRTNLLGAAVTFDDQAYTVVGILPAGFAALSPGVQLYMPLALDAARAETDPGGLFIVGRLAPGASLAAARQELTAIGERFAEEGSETERGLGMTALGLREQFPGPSDRILWSILQTVMLMVLFVACLNVANVLVVRGQDRLREVALRTTLGARRRDLVRQIFAESGLLAVCGGVLGLGLAAWGVDLGSSLLESRLPAWMTPALNLRVGLFTFALTALAGLFVGLFPALRMTHPNLVASLKEGSQTASSGRGRRQLARSMVVAQVALSLVLLSGTGYLVRGILALSNAAPGFDDANLTVFRLNLPARRYPGDQDAATFVSRLQDALEAVPGVEAAVATNTLPRNRMNPSVSFTVEGEDVAPDAQPPSATWIAVSPGYVEKLGIALQAGRTFDSRDEVSNGSTDSPGIAVVSQAWAERYLPGTSPLGRRIVAGGKPLEIVGVVSDVLQNRLFLDKGHSPTVYVPFAQTAERTVYFLVRGRTELAGDLGGTLRAAVAALDPALPVTGLKSFSAHVDEQYQTERLIASFMSSFALFGLLLSAVGIYGIVAYTVSRQTREIGVRMAVGAERSDILQGVLRQGLGLAAVGLAIGVLPAFLVSRLFTAAFGSFVPTTSSVPTLPVVAFVLALVTLVASLLPAQRAADLDPVEALRRD